MTVYLTFQALKLGHLRLDHTATVSEVAASQPPTKFGLPAGARIHWDS
jgi:D-alanyl-D-alanine carboxypeptidase